MASLRLCAEAGMLQVGVVALDGTKLDGNTSDIANRTLAKLQAEVAEILKQAAEADRRDDQEHGVARGDELPAALASKGGRLARLRQAAARLEVDAAARRERYRRGYWSIDNVSQPDRDDGPELLIPPAKHARQGKPRKDGKPSASKSDGLRAAMTAKLASDEGKDRYALRKQTVEPVFGQIKDVRGARRFMRPGLRACAAEWKLLCGTHNLLKLWRFQAAQALVAPATS